MNIPAFRLEAKQQHALTPKLQQAVRLLQMSSLDFALALHQTIEKNPFLELEDGEEAVPASTASSAPALSGDDATEASAPASEQITEADASRSTDEPSASSDADGWTAAASTSRGNGSGDGDLDLLDLAESPGTLQQYLCEQLGTMRLSEREQYLTCVVARSIDDDGYLRLGIDELQQCVDLSPGAEEAEFLAALKMVQSLDPAGVGARNVAECLLLQIDASDDLDPTDKALAQHIVSEHIDLLARRDTHAIAAALKTDNQRAAGICAAIRKLSPHPGWRCGSQVAQYITPDVIVRNRKGQWDVSLNPAVVPKVRLNQLYADLFHHHRELSHGELANQLQEARWTLRNLEQRFVTILRVAKVIVDKQKAFFDYGPQGMRPMGLREISEILGLHESTVSRVTNNKYMATPAGVFELKYFFSRALDTVHGQPRSVTSVRSSIKQMIDEETTVRPLSDAEIARLLTRRGLKVARRTVTKYRQQMRIPPVGMRRAR